MNYTSLITGLFALSMAMPVMAQKKRNTAKKESVLSAEQLIQQYRFEEAAQILQREIKAAEKAGKDTERLDADMRRANMGADMLRGTERVTFVDSFQVSRKQVLNTIRLSPEAGKWVATSSLVDAFKSRPKTLGNVAFVNELNDRIYFAASDSVHGAKTICSAYHSGNKWGTSTKLSGFNENADDQDCPFVMPDGVTVYFASQGDESLGGYDLFVTRYDTETKEYLKPENLGMPFNSPANDFMIAIDESTKLGWLVSDRFQSSADSVCVYVFIPSESREIYEVTEDSREQIIRLARLESIAETQTDLSAVAAARQRMANLVEERGEKSASKRYVINDHTVYTSLKQFRSASAQRIAKQADDAKKQIDELKAKRDELQLKVAQGKRSADVLSKLKQINQVLPQLMAQYETLCKNMRKAELAK